MQKLDILLNKCELCTLQGWCVGKGGAQLTASIHTPLDLIENICTKPLGGGSVTLAFQSGELRNVSWCSVGTSWGTIVCQALSRCQEMQ